MKRYIQSFATDIGTVRKTNQDSLLIQKAETPVGEVVLAAVCDGMGGYNQGELASKICVLELRRWFQTSLPALMPLVQKGEEDEFEHAVFEQWEEVILSVNAQLVALGEGNNQLLGTTATVFLLAGNRYLAAHVGDSRGYLVQKSRLAQVTEDQSFVAWEVREGRMTAEEAMTDKRRSVLLETVGVTENVHILTYRGNCSNETLLLCSDGFWHFVQENELCSLLSPGSVSDFFTLRNNLLYLVEEVKNRGERDNITVVAVCPSTESGQDNDEYGG